tara:strand:- start:1204 stop:2523 length:1320 start_codon:yes stop_codon:yes gene_type:complete
MNKNLKIGLLGLGTVGSGVAKIIQTPKGRNPLVEKLELTKIAVRDVNKVRGVHIPSDVLTENALEVVENPEIQIVVEVMGGIEPARSLIIKAIQNGKSVVTANKAVIARYGDEIALAANKAGVYVLIEAAVGGGIPIIEPLKQSLGANQIDKVLGIINGTTNYILTRMKSETANIKDLIKEAQRLGYAEADPVADIEGFDAADKISILSSLAFGGSINRANIPTKGISKIQSVDVDYAKELGYVVKLLAVAERVKKSDKGPNSVLPLSVWVQPTLIPRQHPLSGVNGVNNAILVEGSPIGEVMFYGPGAGAGPTASAVVADILNIAGVQFLGGKDTKLDPLLAGKSWRICELVKPSEIMQKHYLRLVTEDTPGVIGKIGNILGSNGVSIKSIVQFESSEAGAEIVVVTDIVDGGSFQYSLDEITSLAKVKGIASQMVCI